MSYRLDRSIAKAQRLIDEGRVHPQPDVDVFAVEGDTDTYIVNARPVGDSYAMSCSCPSTSVDCSHALAVRKTLTTPSAVPADPFEGLTS